MKPYRPKLFPSPINLPEKVVGSMAIKHRMIPAGDTVSIVGMRQGLLRGISQKEVFLNEPLRIHQLVETKRGIWMTDLPEELNQIEELIATIQPQGKVLIGGLGLGILAARVASLPDVTETFVVERSLDVIKLVAQKQPYHTEPQDILEFLKTTKEEFDYYLLDTWQGTSEGTWWSEVMPLRRIIRQRWGIHPEIHCWAEDIMWGQIYRALTSPHSRPHWYYSYLPVPMSGADAEAFLNMVGSPWWEKKYGKGVDRYIAETSTRRKRA